MKNSSQWWNGSNRTTYRVSRRSAICWPQIRHYRAWDETQAFVVRGRRLTNDPRPCTLKPSVANFREPSSFWERNYVWSNQKMQPEGSPCWANWMQPHRLSQDLQDEIFTGLLFLPSLLHVKIFMWTVNKAYWFVSVLKHINLHTSALSLQFIERRLKTASEL